MPSDAFPRPKLKELTPEELEGLLEIHFDPSLSVQKVLDFVRKGSDYQWVRFIVTENFNLILSLNMHNKLVTKMGIDREACLVPDGDFRIQKDSTKIEFAYSFYEPEKMANIRKAAENKIKNFLKSKGIEIE
jgi:hypothetical protein